MSDNSTVKKKKKRRDNRVTLKFSLRELTLIYELMHDVRFFYEKQMTEEEKTENAETNLNTALKILGKIERKVLPTDDKKEED